MERSGSILQTNEGSDVCYWTSPFCITLTNVRRPQTTSVFNTFLEAQNSSLCGDSQENIAILRPLGLRYFSPNELLRLFHFTPVPHKMGVSHTDMNCFEWPAGFSDKTKYRLLGNSLNVEVVTRLIVFLFQGDEL